MMKRILSAFFLLGAIVGCAGQNQNDSIAVKQDVEYCPAAQQHLQDLCNQDSIKNKYCCDVVAVSLKNKPFVQVCQEIQNGGVFINPYCISQVSDCNQIDANCMQVPEGNR